VAERGGGHGDGAKADTEPVAGAFPVDQAAGLERGEQSPGGGPLKSGRRGQLGQAGWPAQDRQLLEQARGPGHRLYRRPGPPSAGSAQHGQLTPTRKPSSVLSNSASAAVAFATHSAPRSPAASGPAAQAR